MVTGLPTTRFHAASNRANDENLGIFGATYPHGTVFALRQCLYQKEATGMERLKCNQLVGTIYILADTGLPTTWFHAESYRADDENLGIFGATYPHGTVFALRQCLY